ncbi:type IV pilus assembly protein PilM [Patescibacteria group bacterium]|nr:type IV pilus assembly protein PilM [Patescibacteria group bacterium]
MLNLFQKPFGLDISDYSIEVISLGGSIKNPKLQAMGRKILTPGIFKDGKILNKEDLKKILKNLIPSPQFGKIKTKKLIFSIPESKSFIHILELPKDLKKPEILKFIKSQASQTLPFSLTELYFDFQIKNFEVLLVAAPKNIVNDYLEVFKSCQLRPIALEVESMSLARALIKEEKEIILIADIGTRMTNFSLFDKKRLRLSISIPVAGNKFSQAISEELKIPLKEAEDLKRKVGLNPEIKEGRIFLILQKEIQKIIKEIKNIEKYFQRKEKKTIKKIILAGGSTALPNILEYLSENLEKEVIIPDPWVKINIDILKKKKYFKETLKINQIFYSTVIGLALRGLAKNPKKTGINLIGK